MYFGHWPALREGLLRHRDSVLSFFTADAEADMGFDGDDDSIIVNSKNATTGEATDAEDDDDTSADSVLVDDDGVPVAKEEDWRRPPSKFYIPSWARNRDADGYPLMSNTQTTSGNNGGSGGVDADSKLPTCIEFMQQQGLSNDIRYPLVAMYDPGDCSFVQDPQVHPLCKSGLKPNRNAPKPAGVYTYEDKFGPVVDWIGYPSSLICSPMLFEACQKARAARSPNATGPVRLCAGMPYVFHPQGSRMRQRYTYGAGHKEAVAAVGETCFNKRITVHGRMSGLEDSGGPRVVLSNLLNSLRYIGKPYTISGFDLDNFDALYSHDPHTRLLLYNDLHPRLRMVMGPNIGA